MTSIHQNLLNWANLEEISAPISAYKMKAIATVLTQEGAGTVLCPSCHALNIIRDGKFRCYCGFKSNIIDCACGVCGQQLLDRDRQKRVSQYIKGHHMYGKDNPQELVLQNYLEYHSYFEQRSHLGLLTPYNQTPVTSYNKYTI